MMPTSLTETVAFSDLSSTICAKVCSSSPLTSKSSNSSRRPSSTQSTFSRASAAISKKVSTQAITGYYSSSEIRTIRGSSASLVRWNRKLNDLPPILCSHFDRFLLSSDSYHSLFNAALALITVSHHIPLDSDLFGVSGVLSASNFGYVPSAPCAVFARSLLDALLLARMSGLFVCILLAHWVLGILARAGVEEKTKRVFIQEPCFVKDGNIHWRDYMVYHKNGKMYIWTKSVRSFEL